MNEIKTRGVVLRELSADDRMIRPKKPDSPIRVVDDFHQTQKTLRTREHFDARRQRRFGDGRREERNG